MNNQTVIARLQTTELFSVCELLVICLKNKDDLWETADWVLFSELPDDVIDYCDRLTYCSRLKFLQQIINTLVNEQSAAAAALAKQLELPVG